MYKCYDCGCVFEEPKHCSEDRTPGGAFEGGSFIEHWDGCPNCEGAFNEAHECDGCGEFVIYDYMTLTPDGEFCESCIEEMECGEYDND